MTKEQANRVMKKALALSDADKCVLFQKLWTQLEGNEPLPPAFVELERRFEDLRSGRVKGVSPKKMLSEAKRLL